MEGAGCRGRLVVSLGLSGLRTGAPLDLVSLSGAALSGWLLLILAFVPAPQGTPLHPGHPCAGPGHLPEPQPRPAASAQLFPRRHTQGHRPACQQCPPGVQVPALCPLILWLWLWQLGLVPCKRPVSGGPSLEAPLDQGLVGWLSPCRREEAP